jgi:hypothetical protein
MSGEGVNRGAVFADGWITSYIHTAWEGLMEDRVLSFWFSWIAIESKNETRPSKRQ